MTKMFLKINPHKLQLFLLTNQDFLERKYTEPEESKIGRKRSGLRWLIVAICIVCVNENISWSDIPSMLRSCDFLIEDGYLRYIPSYSKFYNTWDDITTESIERYVIQLGTKVTNSVSPGKFDTAADSSGIGVFN